MATSNKSKKIVVLEPGAWGTALGIVLGKKNRLSFWYEDLKLASRISKTRTNERLPGVKIPSHIFISSDLEKAVKDADLIVIASPSFNLRKTIEKIKDLKRLPPLLGIAKGIEKETLKLPSQIVEELLQNHPYAHLSGPGFASEVAREKDTQEVIASKSVCLLRNLKEIFQVDPLQISTTTDLIGIQLAGAAKNALTIGISFTEAAFPESGHHRIRKSLIKLGLQEMIKIGRAAGGQKKTFLGPAGIGDLVLTASNSISRNFQFGQRFFLDPAEIKKEVAEGRLTVEGFNNVFGLYHLSKNYNLDLPMINEIYKLIYSDIASQEVANNLTGMIKK